MRSLVAFFGLSLLLWAPLAQAQGTSVFSGEISINCLTASTVALPAKTASQIIYIKTPAGTANTVWFNFAGSPATTAAPNVDLTTGQSLTWAMPSFLPQSTVSCISSPASQTISVLYK